MPKLTKRTVDALRPDPAGKDVIHFDTEIPRFGLRIKASGVKSYILQYKNKFGQVRRITLGHPSAEFTPDRARTAALKARARIAEGADPSAERKAHRSAQTVGALCDEYLEAGKGRIKKTTLAMDRSRIERHVKPLIGTRAVASLTPGDMEKFLRDVLTGKTVMKKAGNDGKRTRGGVTVGGPGAASRTLGMLGTILQRAVRDGTLSSNPARGIARPKDQPKKPAFSFEAVTEIGKAIREREASGDSITGLRAIRFLSLTGLRRMEALTLTWGMVDRRARCIRFPDTKSGAQVRPIGRAALELLEGFKPNNAKDADYVFPGTETGRHFVGLPKVWARVTNKAGIADVSLHGLRHWFASAAAEMNFSELTIAGLLGHSVKGVTARYATAPDSALLSAADRVSQRMSDLIDGSTERAVSRIGAVG